MSSAVESAPGTNNNKTGKNSNENDVKPPNKAPDARRSGLTCRSAPNSAASKYRRISFALSRGQSTTNSMKDMMAELGTKLSKKRDPQSSTDGSDLPEAFQAMLQGSPAPAPVTASPVVTEGGEKTYMNDGLNQMTEDIPAITTTVLSSVPTCESPAGAISSPASMQNATAGLVAEVIVQGDGLTSPPPPPPLPPVASLTSTNHESSAKRSPRVRPGAPVSMKDISAELVAKANARQTRSGSPPIPTPPPPPPFIQQARKGQEASLSENRSVGSASKPVGMKDVMNELAKKATAREERSSATPPPPQLLPQRVSDPEATIPDNSRRGKSPRGASKPVSMKEMMSELEAKAKEKMERSTEALPTPTPTPTRPHQPPPTGGRPEQASSAPANTTPRGASKPVSMKDMMAELEVKAKARGERSDPSRQGHP